MIALLSEARNFRQVDERLLTAGQPNEAQLADAARQGVKVVIKLGLHDDRRDSLANEDPDAVWAEFIGNILRQTRT